MERAGGARSRRGRAVRGSISAGIATILAATAHTISGGLAPLWLIVAATLLAAPIAVFLAGRTPSLWRTGLVVLASQGLFHTFFSLAGSATAPVLAPHVHTTGLPAAAPLAHVHAGAGAGMTATHVLAAVITVAALALGERVVRSILGGLRRLARLLASPIPPPTSPRPRAVGERCVLPARLLRSSLSLRGPPVAFA
ncbi:hypothetical protein [Microbacterium sp. cf332]|uniref:hypothetical protein n=1 Tax=Microbacterium sp. cf332 TaxID=1761804 RepID=UPI0008889E09|nr:hypothetical protein [Microbacterium sp. cf332]SDQ83462.1 hypothetical protein SAMN04487847_2675 [Microbacterium sp. cf332]